MNNRVIVAHGIEYHDEFVWEQLKTLQADMLAAGDIELKFAYYGVEDERMVRPLITTNWITDPDDVADIMDRGRDGCMCGCYTPIADILEHALQEAPKALVIFGDSFFGDRDKVMGLARQLRAIGTRVFLFQQGQLPQTQGVYRQLAEITGGAHIRFNVLAERVEERLPEMFAAITSYVLDGPSALEARADEAATLLLEQMEAVPFEMDTIKQKVKVER
jgi:hypothetical protein